jgi:hypothetical protein
MNYRHFPAHDMFGIRHVAFQGMHLGMPKESGPMDAQFWNCSWLSCSSAGRRPVEKFNFLHILFRDLVQYTTETEKQSKTVKKMKVVTTVIIAGNSRFRRRRLRSK